MAIGYHLGIADRASAEALLIIAAALIGAIWDSFLVAAGWLIYPSGTLIENTAPYWIIALWAAFATTFNLSLAWFKTRLIAAAALGLIGGPLAYLAGERLGAVSFYNHLAGLVALALGWGLLMPLMMWLSRRWNGFTASTPVVASAAS